MRHAPSRRYQRSVIPLASALALFAACNSAAPHDHGEAHPAGHDHHDVGHGHGDAPTVSFTRWTDRHELFAEADVPVAGKEFRVLAHLTALAGFTPVGTARVRLEFADAARSRVEVTAPRAPGIFELRATLPAPGPAVATLTVARDGTTDVFPDLPFVVAPSAAEAEKLASADAPEGAIQLLKEQQWGVPFQTVFAEAGTLTTAVEVGGEVLAPPGRMAEVSAPVAGRLAEPPGGFPRPGTKVRKGQLLAALSPAPASPEEAARAGIVVAEAEARASRATSALARATRLLADKAIAAREYEDAAREADVAKAALGAARAAGALWSGATSGAGRGPWKLVSPIAGTLTAVHAVPGASVRPGDTLFQVVDLGEVWIRARVPEAEATRFRADRDASFMLNGGAAFEALRVAGDDPNAVVLNVSAIVDPTSRTVEVIYALKRPMPSLRVGALLRVAVPTGNDFRGVLVPRDALVSGEGRDRVYVQVDGEHFLERSVRVDARNGNLIGIGTNLAAGERVVTTGAQVVRLAATQAAGGGGHGHVH